MNRVLSTGQLRLQDAEMRLAESTLQKVCIALSDEDGLRSDLIHYYRDEVVEEAIARIIGDIGLHLNSIKSCLDVISSFLLRQPHRRCISWYVILFNLLRYSLKSFIF